MEDEMRRAFDRMDELQDRLTAEMDAQFEKVIARLDGLHQTLREARQDAQETNAFLSSDWLKPVRDACRRG